MILYQQRLAAVDSDDTCRYIFSRLAAPAALSALAAAGRGPP